MKRMLLKNRPVYLLTLMVMLMFANGSAQNYDQDIYPADSGAIVYFHNRLHFESPLKRTSIDTSLVDFQAYNWLDRRVPFHASLGNSGLAYRNLEFNPKRQTGFEYGIHSFDTYLFFDDEIKYYLNHNPFTEVGYVTGGSKEQLFHARHQQRVYKKLALGVDFEHINSLGTYQRQRSNNRRVAFKGQYFTEDLRYGVIANYTNSKVNVRENGGIVTDSVYEQNLEPDRSIIDIKLRNAENLVRKSGVYLQQYYQLSAPKAVAANDTVAVPEKRFQLRLGRLSHSFSYQRQSFIYTDSRPDLDYYPNIFVDSTTTYDSVYFQHIQNAFSWTNADYLNRMKPQPLVLLFGIKHRVNAVRDSLLSESYNHLIPYGEVRFTPHPLLNIEGNASIIVSDDAYQGDFNLHGLAQLSIFRRFPFSTTFNFVYEINNNRSPFFYRHYFSNHFIWDNSFSKTLSNRIAAFITQSNLKLGLDVFAINNYIYLAEDTLPAQYDASLEVFKAFLEAGGRIGKFDLHGKAIYQKVSQEDILRLPGLMAHLTLTFNLRLFDGALNTRSGFDFRYFTPYFADAYLPALRSFHIQNEREVGGFIHADFFINFTVKRTRFFLKFQNVLSIIDENYDYFAVPHYPLQDFGFKFGLDWRFYD
jgi:hypothetical protein